MDNVVFHCATLQWIIFLKSIKSEATEPYVVSSTFLDSIFGEDYRTFVLHKVSHCALFKLFSCKSIMWERVRAKMGLRWMLCIVLRVLLAKTGTYVCCLFDRSCNRVVMGRAPKRGSIPPTRWTSAPKATPTNASIKTSRTTMPRCMGVATSKSTSNVSFSELQDNQ